MQLTPDALKLLGLALDWNRLALVLGALALLTLVGRRRDGLLDRAAMWGLARSVLDLRTGTLSLGWALGVGLLTILVIARRRVSELLPALLGAALIGAVPLLLKPAPTLSTVPGTTPLERYASPGDRATPVTFRDLPGPTLVNVWASWCPPCRLEMPLLVNAARRGHPVTLIDSAEPPATVAAYLQSVGLLARTSGISVTRSKQGVITLETGIPDCCGRPEGFAITVNLLECFRHTNLCGLIPSGVLPSPRIVSLLSIKRSFPWLPLT